jgi:hypothetical protein
MAIAAEIIPDSFPPKTLLKWLQKKKESTLGRLS